MSSHRVPGRGQDTLQQTAIVALVLGAAFSLFVLSTVTSMRNFAILGGGALVALGAVLSGNPRLYCLWGLMLTVPLNLSKRFGPMFLGKPGGEDSFRIEISDIFLICLVGFLLWDVVMSRRRGIRIPRPTIPWVMLIVIGMIWIVVGPWRTTAAHEVVRMIKVATLFVVIANLVDTPKRVWHCAAGLAAGAILQGTVALIQYAKRGLIGLEVLGETTERTIQVLEATSVQGADVFRPSALLQHANLMGMYFAVLLPLAIAMLLTSRRTGSRSFFTLVIALASPGVVISLSRSAWLSAAVAVAVVLFVMPLHPKLRWRSARATGIVGVVGLLVVISLSGPIIERAFRSKDDSTVAREIYKADAKRMIAAAPILGHGLNSYVFELPNYTHMSVAAYGGHLPSVHHIYYLWWAETGLVGLILWLTVWGSIIWMGISNLGVKNEFLFAVNAACLAAMICLIPDGFLSFTLRVNTMLRMFWLLAGLIAAIRYMRLRELREARIRFVTEATAVAAPEPEPVPSG